MSYKEHPLKGLIRAEDLDKPVTKLSYFEYHNIKNDTELNFIHDMLLNRLCEVTIWDEECYITSKNDTYYRNEFSNCIRYSGIRKFTNKMMIFYQLQRSDDPTKGTVKYCTKINKDGTFRYGEAKLGKVLKKMFPMLLDHMVEDIVNEYKVKFLPITAEVQFSDDIVKVVELPMSSQRTNFGTTRFMKSLADSCMRHGFDFLKYHPFKAYESGDFEIAYLLDGKGNLAARTILRKSNKSYAPIYTVSFPYGNALKKQLNEKGYISQEEDKLSWVGARLLYIQGYYGSSNEDDFDDDVDDKFECVILPYLDIVPTMYGRVVDKAWIEIPSMEEIVGDSDSAEEYLDTYLEDTYDYCEVDPDLSFKWEYVDVKNSEGYYEC